MLFFFFLYAGVCVCVCVALLRFLLRCLDHPPNSSHLFARRLVVTLCFLACLDVSTRFRLAKVDEKLTKLERQVTYLEGRLASLQ
jgi:hypothetical protein